MHGTLWLDSDKINPFKDKYTGEFKIHGDENETVDILIDKWVSCRTDTDNKILNQLVKDVNTHKHTKSRTPGSALFPVKCAPPRC